jgi:hypothetical protein
VPVVWSWTAPHLYAQQTDLDAFMQRVVARRDDNWKRLQQYVLDEREHINITGPGGATVWGERREYTWYLRDGFFVRSPVKVNGVTIGEAERRRYEARYLQRVQRREKREAENPSSDTPPAAAGLSSLIQQTTEPGFISSAYFLRFKFDAGQYALVGKEILDGREVVRVEYYPTRLFEERQDEERRRRERQAARAQQNRNQREVTIGPNSEAVAVETRRLMNKTSLVTLWIDPAAHQILKYTFDNVDLDFFPGSWLVRMNEVKATMTMSEAFPDVWLPRGLDIGMGLALAVGEFNVRYGLDYSGYRQAEVTSTIRMPGDTSPR